MHTHTHTHTLNAKLCNVEIPKHNIGDKIRNSFGLQIMIIVDFVVEFYCEAFYQIQTESFVFWLGPRLYLPTYIIIIIVISRIFCNLVIALFQNGHVFPDRVPIGSAPQKR